MNGPLFAEAVTVLFVTCRALAYWIAAAAFTAAVVVVAGLGCGVWAVRGLWRRWAGPLTASQAQNARSVLRLPDRRPAPRWALPPNEAPESAKPQKAA